MNLSWVVVYKDESLLYQNKPDGTENAYSDIDRENLSEFHIVDLDREGETVYALALDPGDRLIYRKRHQTRGDGEHLGIVYMVGWQRTVKGENVQSIGWIFPNGSVIQTGRFHDDHVLFYHVESMDFEDVKVS